MHDEEQPDAGIRDATSTGAKETAGERLDQFLAGAKGLRNIAGRRAKEIVDTATPHLKEIGKNATEKATSLINQQRTGGVLKNALAFYSGGGKRRKQVILFAGGAYILLMILLIPILFFVTSKTGSGNSSASSNSGDPTEQLLQSMQGTWRFEGEDGQGAKIIISEHTIHWPDKVQTGVPSIGVDGMMTLPDVTFVLNAAHSPAWIDYNAKTAKWQMGVVEVEGDILKIMMSNEGDRRPENFDDITGNIAKSRVETYHRIN